LKVSEFATPPPIQPTALPPEARCRPDRRRSSQRVRRTLRLVRGHRTGAAGRGDRDVLHRGGALAVTVTGLMPACRNTDALAVAVAPEVEGSVPPVTDWPSAVSVRVPLVAYRTVVV